jgi:hypothetical protein
LIVRVSLYLLLKNFNSSSPREDDNLMAVGDFEAEGASAQLMASFDMTHVAVEDEDNIECSGIERIPHLERTELAATSPERFRPVDMSPTPAETYRPSPTVNPTERYLFFAVSLTTS